jgi:hypothetical protein
VADSADLTNLSEALKRVYDPVIKDQTNKEPFTYNEFSEGDDELGIGGEGWFFGAKMGGNQEGIGARPERGTLADAGYQRWKQGKIYWKLTYGSFEITGPAIEASKRNPMAFARLRTDEIKELTRDVIKDYNFQVWGKGDGVLDTVSADGPSAKTMYVYDRALWLRLNMKVTIWNAGALRHADVDGVKITSPTTTPESGASRTSPGSMATRSFGTETRRRVLRERITSWTVSRRSWTMAPSPRPTSRSPGRRTRPSRGTFSTTVGPTAT